MTSIPVIGELTVMNVLFFLMGFIILWVLVSVPVYLAGKVVTSGQSTLGDAMIATVFGPIVYVVTLLVVDLLFSSILGSTAYIVALVLAFIAWLGVFKISFGTGWLGSLAIALLAILVYAAISTLFGILLDVVIPAPFFPKF
ncbi:MAG: hypothetical protein ACBZ72_02495 [Candidatus Bathyarchaeia archaeon]